MEPDIHRSTSQCPNWPGCTWIPGATFWPGVPEGGNKKVLALMDQTRGIFHGVLEFIGWFWIDWGFGVFLDIPSVGMNSSLHRAILNPFWNLALELIRIICSMVEPCVTQAACWHETANGIYLTISGSFVIYPKILRSPKLPRFLERAWEKTGRCIKFRIAIPEVVASESQYWPKSAFIFHSNNIFLTYITLHLELLHNII